MVSSLRLPAASAVAVAALLSTQFRPVLSGKVQSVEVGRTKVGGCNSASDCNSAQCEDCACVGGQCQCADGWIGADCSKPFCTQSDPSCGNGTCVQSKSAIYCKCNPGWQGYRCTVKGCGLTCKHGSLPNADCTACGSCVGGWTGAACDIWNSSMTITELVSAYDAHLGSMKSQVEAAASAVNKTDDPLPGWQQVAASVNIVSGELGVPFLDFSFTQRKGWDNGDGKNYSVPDAMEVTSGYVPGGHAHDPVALLSPSAVTAEQLDNLASGVGTAGFFGGILDPTALLNTAFIHGISLAVYTTTWPVYDLRVPNASSSNTGSIPLSRYARAAIESLPPTYDDSTRVVFDAFIGLFGTHYAISATYGGMNQTALAWPSCLWKGSSPDPDDPDDCLLTQDNLDQHVANQDFGGESRVFSQAQYGGDPSINSTDKWSQTISRNPVAISYQGVPLSVLLTGNNVDQGTALDKALQAYLANATTTAKANGASADKAASNRAQPITFEYGGDSVVEHDDDAHGQCGPSTLSPGKDVELSCPDTSDSIGKGCTKYKLTAAQDTGSYGETLAVSNEISKLEGKPSSCGCSKVLSEVVPKKSVALSSCDSRAGYAYNGDSLCEYHNVHEADDCCDICTSHRSCEKWTHDHNSKVCRLFSDTSGWSISIGCYSGQRDNKPSDDVYAKLCFDCRLDALSWVPPATPPATDSLQRISMRSGIPRK